MVVSTSFVTENVFDRSVAHRVGARRFNLVPIGSLDGGRIASAISPWVNVAGLGIGGIAIYEGLIGNPIFYLIMLAGTYSTGARLLGYEQTDKSYYDIPFRTKAGITAGYVALIAALLIGTRPI